MPGADMRRAQSKPSVKYEASYGSFEGNRQLSETNQRNLGRKVFGAFVPEVDVLTK